MQDSNLEDKRAFIPHSFIVPESIQNKYFRIRMLTISDVVKDYDAVMSSVEHLNKAFPNGGWPTKDFSLEQNLIDLGWHQKEFQKRKSFAYTVVSLDESEVLGCIYIDPTDKCNFDSEIHMWVRQSELENGLDSKLFTLVKEWVSKEWPFNKVAYPGRDFSFETWDLLS